MAMKWMAMLVVVFAIPAHAQQAEDDDALLTSQISTMAACAGYYSWVEKFQKSTEHPASADYIHTLVNGTTLAGSYLLSMQSRLRNHDRASHPGSYWTDALSRRADTTFLRMKALEEAGDVAEIKAQAEICSQNGEVVESVLNIMRSSMPDAS